MEKYLIILIITIICYNIFRYCIQYNSEKMKEGFVSTSDTDLDDIETRLDKLEKLPGSMRLFQMTVDNVWNMKIVDSDNNSFDSNEWVCSVQGLSMDWIASMQDVKAIYQFCYIKDNEWWIRSAMDPIGTQIGKPVILAIPRIFFVKNDISTFK
jgi:hypothetical protein